MEILLNGNLLQIEGVDENTTVNELVQTVEGALKGSERTIVDIVIDGKWYSPDDDMESIGNLKLLSFNKVELGAATAKEMVLEGFKDASEGLSYIENLSSDVSTDLRLGRVRDAMSQYVKFVDGIEWLLAMFNNADRAFASNMAESSMEMERINLLKRLKEQMLAIELAQSQENWVEVADILEYEFSDIFIDIRNFIAKLLSR